MLDMEHFTSKDPSILERLLAQEGSCDGVGHGARGVDDATAGTQAYTIAQLRNSCLAQSSDLLRA